MAEVHRAEGSPNTVVVVRHAFDVRYAVAALGMVVWRLRSSELDMAVWRLRNFELDMAA